MKYSSYVNKSKKKLFHFVWHDIKRKRRFSHDIIQKFSWFHKEFLIIWQYPHFVRELSADESDDVRYQKRAKTSLKNVNIQVSHILNCCCKVFKPFQNEFFRFCALHHLKWIVAQRTSFLEILISWSWQIVIVVILLESLILTKVN